MNLHFSVFLLFFIISFFSLYIRPCWIGFLALITWKMVTIVQHFLIFLFFLVLFCSVLFCLLVSFFYLLYFIYLFITLIFVQLVLLFTNISYSSLFFLFYVVIVVVTVWRCWRFVATAVILIKAISVFYESHCCVYSVHIYIWSSVRVFALDFVLLELPSSIYRV